MVQSERARRYKREEPEEEGHHRKKAPESLHNRSKAPDEDVTDFQAEPSFDRHAALLVGAKTDVQRANLTMHLQQTYGNRYVQRLVELLNVQAKLTVSSPDDVYEKEADRVADAVTKASASTVQRQEEEEEPIQTKLSESRPNIVSKDLEADINTARGSGQPLPDSVRSSLEPQLGHDFSQVHIHTDAKADKLSQQLGAEAFTTGHDIFFREGAYQPGSDSGQGLIAHELTHVVQQGMTRVSRQAAETEQAAADPKEEARKELKDDVDKLKTKLEREYIKDLLRIAGNCQAQGMDESAYKWAMEEAAEAALTMLKRKTAGLDVKSAKKEMVTELLNAAADVMKLGGDDKAVESALKKALDWAEAQLVVAVKNLKPGSPKANAREVAAKAVQVQLLGGDPVEAWEALKKWEEESGEGGKPGKAK